jgi:hypothetical protein
MISLERCRKVLGPKNRLSDENLATLREQLYCFAELVLQVRADKKNSSTDTAGLLERATHSKEDLEANGLIFDGESYRTAPTCIAFSYLQGISEGKSSLASLTGVEPVSPP